MKLLFKTGIKEVDDSVLEIIKRFKPELDAKYLQESGRLFSNNEVCADDEENFLSVESMEKACEIVLK